MLSSFSWVSGVSRKKNGAGSKDKDHSLRINKILHPSCCLLLRRAPVSRRVPDWRRWRRDGVMNRRSQKDEEDRGRRAKRPFGGLTVHVPWITSEPAAFGVVVVVVVTFALKMRKVMFWSPCMYLFICMRFIRITKKVTFGGMIGYYPGTIWLDFGIDRVKVKVMERSKSSCYHSTVNVYPIGMQLMPKCS